MLLDYIGWEERGPGGDGFNILCPNDANHSNAGDPDDKGCWVVQRDDDFVITCQHDHCQHLGTWDHLRLIETSILEGHAHLPDEYETLSDLLCDGDLYPVVDGEEFTFDPHDYGVPFKIPSLGSPSKVKRAFDAVQDNVNASQQYFAALYAGVERAGNKAAAVDKLDALMKTLTRFSANDRKALKKRGADMLKADRAAWKANEEAETLAKAASAAQNTDLADPSMDIADPLGDTLEKAMATLGNRYALVDVQGKFRAIRKPDLSVLAEKDGRMKSVIVASTIPDFQAFHGDRQITVKDQQINPAKMFVETQKRHSDLVFAPYPAYAGPNDFNMYYGRVLQGVEGGQGDIPDFILNTVCDCREELYDWVILYLAHMVQRPGEKPGTSIVCYGVGGAGKGTFGDIMTALTLPHAKLIENEAHLIGQFAGEHLSTCIFAHVTEAVFPAGKNSSALKNLVSGTSILAEPKGLSVMDVPSYLRVYFDSNSSLVVPIEGNGSERRYLVMKIAEAHVGDAAYFAKFHKQIKGREMQAFLHMLENYVPEDHKFTWNDVRLAPHTPERGEMQYQTMRPAVRAMLAMFEDGVVTLYTPEGPVDYIFNQDAPTRLPSGLLREHLSRAGNKNNADDADPSKIMEGLFGEEIEHDGDKYPSTKTGQGVLVKGDDKNVRWVEFPPLKVLRAQMERFGRGSVDNNGGDSEEKGA